MPDLIDESKRWLRCTICRRDPAVRSALFAPASTPARGWAGRALVRPTLLFVATNPGHPLHHERGVWNAVNLQPGAVASREQAKAVHRVCTDAHEHPPAGRSGTYHRKVAPLARALLRLVGRPDGDPEWLDSCWLTDLVKCSTSKEVGGVGRELATNCRPFLRDEIRLAKPALVVALGGVAYDHASAIGGECPVVKFRHPSNGCPRLESRAHDDSFAAAIGALRAAGLTAHDRSYAYDRAFREVRRQLLAGYIPERRPREPGTRRPTPRP